MLVQPITKTNFGACVKHTVLPKGVKKLNRSILRNTGDVSALYGPKEQAEAKKVVAAYTALNAGTAAITAQAPGFDEACLSAIEVAMAIAIYNGVYDFKFSETTIQSLLTGLIGNRVGTYAFKGASKFLTWMPGIGNGLNAIVAGGTTAALGTAIIKNCEKMQEDEYNREKLREILDEEDKDKGSSR